jgi:hypothetical protein
MVSNKTAGGLTAEMDVLTCARRSSMSRSWVAAMMMALRTTVARTEVCIILY